MSLVEAIEVQNPVGPAVRRLSGMTGAEVSNLHIKDMTPEQGLWMREVLREHKVVVLRNQHGVSPHDLANFGRLLGEIVDDPHHMHSHVSNEPAVKVLVMDLNTAAQIPVDSWHTDGAAHSNRGFISILQAVDIPDYGRDTVFADMEAAYDHLSAPMKAFLDGLTALHSWGAAKPHAPDVERPVVLTDPKSGRKALFVNQRYTRQIKGLRRDESDALLSFLCSQARFPEFQVRLSWEPGTIALWENDKTQHAIVFDRAYKRTMHRVWVYASPE
jgi:taurine dioxygenase